MTFAGLVFQGKWSSSADSGSRGLHGCSCTRPAVGPIHSRAAPRYNCFLCSAAINLHSYVTAAMLVHGIMNCSPVRHCQERFTANLITIAMSHKTVLGNPATIEHVDTSFKLPHCFVLACGPHSLCHVLMACCSWSLVYCRFVDTSVVSHNMAHPLVTTDILTAMTT